MRHVGESPQQSDPRGSQFKGMGQQAQLQFIDIPRLSLQSTCTLLPAAAVIRPAGILAAKIKLQGEFTSCPCAHSSAPGSLIGHDCMKQSSGSIMIWMGAFAR
jgi:hypothetical protein